jgi:hypothetical protein
MFYDHVITSQLEWHAATNFNITNDEVSKVIDIMKMYEKEKPYVLLQH